MAAQFAPSQIFHAAASGHARMVQEWLAGGGDANADAHPHDIALGAKIAEKLAAEALGDHVRAALRQQY